MKKHFIINWQIYPFSVLVSIGESHKEVVKRINKTAYKLSKEEEESLWMTGEGRTVMLEGGQTIIRLKTLDKTLIAHEVFHAVYVLMDRIGVKLTMDSDETFAYAIQYLTKEIYAKLKKTIK